MEDVYELKELKVDGEEITFESGTLTITAPIENLHWYVDVRKTRFYKDEKPNSKKEYFLEMIVGDNGWMYEGYAKIQSISQPMKQYNYTRDVKFKGRKNQLTQL